MSLVWEQEFQREVGFFSNAHKGVNENDVMAAMLARKEGKAVLLLALHSRELFVQGQVDDEVNALKDLRFRVN